MWSFLSATGFWIVVVIAVILGGLKEVINVNAERHGVKGRMYPQLMLGLTGILVALYIWQLLQYNWIAALATYIIVFVTSIPAGMLAKGR